MDADCTRIFVLEAKYSDSKLRQLKAINTFYEAQMKIGRPVYFSPNFLYRIFIDGESKKITINQNTTNVTVLTLEERKHLMYQKSKNMPMIYFHDNDRLVYLTQAGVEKVFLIEKEQRKRRTIYSIKEIANIFYSEKEMIRRVLFDQFNFKKELGSQIRHLHML